MTAVFVVLLSGLGIALALAITIKRAYDRAPVRSRNKDTIEVRTSGKIITIDISSSDSQRSKAIDDALTAVRSGVNHAA